MDGYRVVRAQEVEFRDLDGLGHVNNAVYLSYLGPDGRLVAEGSSVPVAFDYASGEPVEIPDAWRRLIETHEAETVAA